MIKQKIIIWENRNCCFTALQSVLENTAPCNYFFENVIKHDRNCYHNCDILRSNILQKKIRLFRIDGTNTNFWFCFFQSKTALNWSEVESDYRRIFMLLFNGAFSIIGTQELIKMVFYYLIFFRCEAPGGHGRARAPLSRSPVRHSWIRGTHQWRHIL